jgi:hypothetical protein
MLTPDRLGNHHSRVLGWNSPPGPDANPDISDFVAEQRVNAAAPYIGKWLSC